MALPAADDEAPPRAWPPQLRAAAAVGWSSFLGACLGTLLCFAALDPQLIIDGLDVGEVGPLQILHNRTAIYTLGFFLFWVASALAAWLACVLTRGPAP
jgi:hypothetical protein